MVLGGGAPRPPFQRRTVAIPPGGERAALTAGWPDAIVEIVAGEVELELRGSTRARFRRGDLVPVEAGSLRALRNPGATPARLVAVFHRDESPAAQPCHRHAPRRST